ncbi:MAG: 30S ribosomal protein S20 [Armatimonadetes bacterium]|nr:30S ribosomal protein S20 [Armatimonadota bacterium]
MPNTRSAAKRARQSLKRRARNLSAKSEIKTLTRKCRAAIDAGDLDAARDLARQTESRLDKAAKKGIIHANNARRRATRLHRAVSVAKPEASES